MSMKNLQKRISVTPRDSQTLDQYMRDIAQLPRLSVEEEVSLAQRIRTGDEKAFEQLVLGNVRFVITVAKHYQGCGLDLPDLISAGNIGLVTAAKRFDETMGNKFCSYAVWWIRQSILQALAKEGRMVALPANKVTMLSKIGKESARLEQELQRMPSRTELTDRLQEKEKRIGWLLRSSEKPMSLDAPLQSEEDVMRIDTLTDPSAPKTDDKLMKESLHHDIEAVLSNLSKNESNILKLSYGIGCTHAYSMEEIAQRMRLSRERVRQIHNKAISRLQHSSSKELLRAYL